MSSLISPDLVLFKGLSPGKDAIEMNGNVAHIISKLTVAFQAFGILNICLGYITQFNRKLAKMY